MMRTQNISALPIGITTLSLICWCKQCAAQEKNAHSPLNFLLSPNNLKIKYNSLHFKHLIWQI